MDHDLHGYLAEHALRKERIMKHHELHFHKTTTLTPEQYVGGLPNFRPGRWDIFVNSADDYIFVHRQTASEADLTEGSGGIWERLHYDRSDPQHFIRTTTNSNLWGGQSGHTYTFTPRPDGTTDIDVVVIREGKNLKGRLLGFLLRTIGRRVPVKDFENSVKTMEARNGVIRNSEDYSSCVQGAGEGPDLKN